MGNYRETPKRSRVEVPFPASRGSRPRRPHARRPARNDAGTNPMLLNAGIVVLATLLTTVLLLAISGQLTDTTSARLIAVSPAPLPPASPANSQVSPPSLTPSPKQAQTIATPSPGNDEATPAATPDDAEVQAAIDAKLASEASLVQLGITATVNDGRVVLVGTAPSDELKERVAKLVRAIHGVRQVDNQIVVITQ